MKTIERLKLSFTLTLLAFSDIAGANIWAPTNADSNFFTMSALFGVPADYDLFGIFEDSADITGGALPVLSFTSGSTVSFAANGFNYDISNVLSNGTLFGSDHFQLGWFSPSGSWIGMTAGNPVNLAGNNVWQLVFDPATAVLNDEKLLFAVDIKQSVVAADSPTTVPVPAAIWLFASTGLGMFGLSLKRAKCRA